MPYGQPRLSTSFRPLPVVPFEASRKESRISSSLSLVRFDDNDYSVPVAYAHHTVTLKGSCGEVRIYSGPEEIARHERIWAKEQIRLDPVHYLALLERKPGSLDYARPMVFSGFASPRITLPGFSAVAFILSNAIACRIGTISASFLSTI